MFTQISSSTVNKITTIISAHEVVDIGVILRTVTEGVSEALVLVPGTRLDHRADGTVHVMMRWR